MLASLPLWMFYLRVSVLSSRYMLDFGPTFWGGDSGGLGGIGALLSGLLGRVCVLRWFFVYGWGYNFGLWNRTIIVL